MALLTKMQKKASDRYGTRSRSSSSSSNNNNNNQTSSTAMAGTIIGSASYDGTVRLWSVTGKCLKVLEGPTALDHGV